VLVKQYGLGQGFDIYDDDLSQGKKIGRSMVPSRRGSITLESAISWLKTVPEDKPVFMWLHLYDPHAPYDPPPEFRNRFPGDPYGAEIAFADSVVERLVEELRASGRLDNTIVTVLGDHGEGLGEHGEKTHGILLHQATIHVPWILTTPGMERPMRFREPVSIADMAPLLANLTGVAPPNEDRLDGKMPFGNDRRGIDGTPIYFESMLPLYQYGWSTHRGLRSGDWNLITGAYDELFNLRRDPRELSNVADTETLELENLNRILENFEASDQNLDPEVARDLPPSEREALQALGYLATTAPPRRSPPDPRDLIGAHVRIEKAQSLLAAGLASDALGEIEKMLEEDPENIAALNLRAKTFMSMGELDKAEEAYRTSLEFDPANSDSYSGLCRLEQARGNHEKVVELARLGRKSRSPFGVFDAMEARSLISLGRHAEAEALIARKLAENPEDPDLLTARAIQLAGQGRLDEAEADLRKAVEAGPFHWNARSQLGNLLESSGRLEEAIEVFEQLLHIQADDADTLASIGTILVDTDTDASIPYLEEACRLAPGRNTYLTTLGVAYLKVGRLNEAESAFRRSIEIDPDEPSVRNNLGIALTHGGRFDEAIAVLSKLVEDSPGFYKARNNLAIALGESGDLFSAEQQIDQALAKHPDFTDGLLTLSAIHDRNGRIDKVYAVLKRAADSAPDRLDVKMRLAIAAAKAGDCETTLGLFEAQLDSPATFPPELAFEVGRCLEQHAQLRAALGHYEHAARKSTAGLIRDEAMAAVQRIGIQLGESE
jgi:choline-sulfatase